MKTAAILYFVIGAASWAGGLCLLYLYDWRVSAATFLLMYSYQMVGNLTNLTKN